MNENKLYKHIIYKIIVKFCIFTIITMPSYYSIIDNDQSNKLIIYYPFSAYTSLLFFCIDTNIFIEIPLMLLAINSFLVWSINTNRTSIINFLDLTCIFWVMICYITCLNYTKTYNSIFRYQVCDYYFEKILLYITNFFKPCVNIFSSNDSLLNINNDVSHEPGTIMYTPFIIQNYTYFNYEFLLIPIDTCIILYIIIVLNTSIKQKMIDFLNNNITILVGSLVIYTLLVVPIHYTNKKFLLGYFVMILGFILKVMYLLNIMNIDFATGLFHICAVFSCQMLSIVINNNHNVI
jgi:hypothetical protein